ncbi:NAD(P)-binding protein [Aspergillus floccosus]
MHIMASKTFNVGVVGYGLAAKVFHIPFILKTPQFNLYSIVQRNPTIGDSAPDDYPNLRHYRDFKDLLADTNVDVVVVTTPPNHHFTMTKDALEAGKHVLTEKPFVPTAREADELDAVAKKTGRLLCIYQNRRWDSDFLILKHLLSRGDLGRIVEFNTHYDRYQASPSGGWRAGLGIVDGGSVLYDLGPHLIDQVYTLFGMPKSVHGRLISQRDGALDLHTPDNFYAQLVYPNGMLVHIRVSSLSAEVDQPRYWVRGTQGSFHKKRVDPQEDQLKDGMTSADPGFGTESPGNFHLVVVGDDGKLKEVSIPDLVPETYQALYNKFGRAVESGKEEEVPVKASQARDVLMIIEAIQESARTGKDVFIS